MTFDISTVTALWWAVIVSGLYHGLNPGMGWPLAVSSALMERKTSALPMAIAALAFGHFLSMLAILLPFSFMSFLIYWEREIRMVAGCLVFLFGCYLFINTKHPRFLARVPPTRLALWSFLAAIAHGAGLMLLPIYLGICASDPTQTGIMESGHEAAQSLMTGNLVNAVIVALVHTLAMSLAGGLLATLVYFWLGLKFLSQSWFNLDKVWAVSLILVGLFSVYSAV